MTTSAVSGLNCMGDCMVKIEVTNMSSHATRSGSSEMKVPFSSLSRTMQFIHRSGGKVVEVTKLSAIDTLADLPPVATPVYTSTTNLSTKSPETTPVRSEQKPAQNNTKRGGKQNRR
jgi:CpcD/allophycocyanin linker domain